MGWTGAFPAVQPSIRSKCKMPNQTPEGVTQRQRFSCEVCRRHVDQADLGFDPNCVQLGFTGPPAASSTGLLGIVAGSGPAVCG